MTAVIFFLPISILIPIFEGKSPSNIETEVIKLGN